ncbi:MAG: hypothetical protein JRI79_03400 [Deltaproteobacteria bacterium]|nr:hypothetical protein [Deltaproteobacteria bacterium]MBW1919201.1 hypothetical protein [Deltaproteobacteria bacterium]MBW1934549.1 hypothetical protein [Deltaproteobacteria bacterium]MBW1977007.1 hypothetical protein [Deltaproteobacteria bacterium]MBW2044058.1 hypothetical protein [Deltaproteobacteria bacterium]
MNKKESESETVICPLGRFLSDLQKAYGKKTKFFDHLNQSRVEFLKAIRSLLDQRIEDLESKTRSRQTKKATKIKVE